jgi:hypothetical protein
MPHIAVDDEADLMAARGLTAREVEHVPEQAAERRSHHMQDSERSVAWSGHASTLLVDSFALCGDSGRAVLAAHPIKSGDR